jgi:hypothetical protein
MPEGIGREARDLRRGQARRVARADQFVDELCIALHGLARQRLGAIRSQPALLHQCPRQSCQGRCRDRWTLTDG